MNKQPCMEEATPLIAFWYNFTCWYEENTLSCYKNS